MANLSSVLARAAADHGERPAVGLDDLVLSYSQLRDAAGAVRDTTGPGMPALADGPLVVHLPVKGPFV